MLTPYEVGLLRQSVREIAEVTREVLASGNDGAPT